MHAEKHKQKERRGRKEGEKRRVREISDLTEKKILRVIPWYSNIVFHHLEWSVVIFPQILKYIPV